MMVTDVVKTLVVAAAHPIIVVNCYNDRDDDDHGHDSSSWDDVWRPSELASTLRVWRCPVSGRHFTHNATQHEL